MARVKNGDVVRQFEAAFSEYSGARYCIALANGTATLETALVALGVGKGDHVTVPPITHAATTIAVLRTGATPLFRDVNKDTWLMEAQDMWATDCAKAIIPVSLYGLESGWYGANVIDDAAQTLRPHNKKAAFTSWSFQGSKILSLGEGGMLGTDDPELARRARWYSSLGYDLQAGSSKIDPTAIKDPGYVRHVQMVPNAIPTNYRMNDITAERGLEYFRNIAGFPAIEAFLGRRKKAASWYREAIQGCDWITPQYVPEGYHHDYWAYTVALKDKSLWHPFTEAIVRNGGERPFGAWLPTYFEPAFKHLGHPGLCPVAEDLQPRLVQAQTNNLESAEKNARAWAKAIEEIGG